MTSLLNTQMNGSQKKLMETFSTYQTKTLKKQENKELDNPLNLNARTKNNVKKNEQKKQKISTFQLSQEISSQGYNKDNNFSNIDILKDSTYFSNAPVFSSFPFSNALNPMGIEGGDYMENSFLNPKPSSPNLKRIKVSPTENSIHIDPPKNFFEELTPEILQSRVMHNQNLSNIKDNDSLMFFYGIKPAKVNTSIMIPKNINCQVLSPSRKYEQNRFGVMNQNKVNQQDAAGENVGFQTASYSNIGQSMGPFNFQTKTNGKLYKDTSPDNVFWNKELYSPEKELIPKSKYFTHNL
jgi:hypothetical protein